MIDSNAFNFSALKEELGIDPFAQQNTSYAKDERFFVLTKDKDGNGASLIRLLPDSEKGMIQKLFKINTTITKNEKRRFVSEFSPSTIGQPCPFQEKWQELWNSGDKEGAKVYGRGVRYVTNIKILKDPANPENEGKIFMYEMSGAMKDKIQNAVDPSQQDMELGAQPKELFNPLNGNSFRLVAKRGANGQINYESSEVVNDMTSIYDTVEDALEDIKNNTFLLSDLIKPEAFMSYEDLQKKEKWVTFSDIEATMVADVALVEVKVPDVVESQDNAQPIVTETDKLTTEKVEKAQSPAVEPATEVKKSKQDSSLDELLKCL
jgi:hypothetical protein